MKEQQIDAFADGKKRGLILMNVDVTMARDVTIKINGAPKGTATQWRLNSAKTTDNNEWEVGDNPPVTVVENKIDGFKNGHTLALPVHSMPAAS